MTSGRHPGESGHRGPVRLPVSWKPERNFSFWVATGARLVNSKAIINGQSGHRVSHSWWPSAPGMIVGCHRQCADTDWYGLASHALRLLESISSSETAMESLTILLRKTPPFGCLDHNPEAWQIHSSIHQSQIPEELRRVCSAIVPNPVTC